MDVIGCQNSSTAQESIKLEISHDDFQSTVSERDINIKTDDFGVDTIDNSELNTQIDEPCSPKTKDTVNVLGCTENIQQSDGCLKRECDTSENTREYNKRNNLSKNRSLRDARHGYNNQNRRGRFYSSRRKLDGPQYRVFPAHIPPSLPSTSQDTEVPPPDPVLLQMIENDPPGVVRISEGMKEVRFYGESAVVMLDWDDPRDISFQAGSRRVIIDDLDIITLPFNAPYTPYTLYDGRTINIRLGAPTRDLFIDGKFFDARFGGPPVEIPIDGTYHRVQLGGPLPHMCLGTKKRTDLVAGRINLIVDEQVQHVVYLDSKPQKFEINGIPFILKFDETLLTASINGKPFRIEFGGMAIHINCYREVHSLRFSSLPLGVSPGFVNFLDIFSQNSFDPYRSAKIIDALSIRQPSSSQDFYNYHYHYHYHCSSPQSQQIKSSFVPQTNDVMPAVEYKVLLDPPNVSGQMIDVKELFKKLVEKGIVPAVAANEPTLPPNPPLITNVQVDFSRPETLKFKNLRIIRDLHRGNQCPSCGMRFVRRDTSYINHLRYHEEDGKPNEICSKRWWSHATEFLSEFDEDLPSWFHRNGKVSITEEQIENSIISVGDCEFESESSSAMCICCDDNFSELPEERKKDCCVANVNENPDDSGVVDLSNSDSGTNEKTDVSTTDTTETIIVDDSSLEETSNDDGLIDIVSDEELEPGEIIDGKNEAEGDILEIVELKPNIETIELSDDEIEEGEIVDAPEPIPLMDIDFSKIKIKKEKFDEGYYRHSGYHSEKWLLDGNFEYSSANLVKPKKIKVNISSVFPSYYHRKKPSRRDRKRIEVPEVEPRPATVKPRISRSSLSVNISKSKGRESSALCSLM